MIVGSVGMVGSATMGRGGGWRAAAMWCALLGASTGCDVADAPEPGPLEGSEAVSEAERRADAPEDLAVARPKKGRVIGGERVARAVAWPDATAIDADVRTRMTSDSAAAIARSPVPVLVPTLDGSERGQLMVGEGWYAFSGRVPGGTVSVQGSGSARVHPHIGHHEPTQSVRGRGAFVSENEAIWSVTWIEHGVAYALELECDDPRAAACDGPDEAVALVESMVFVGGRDANPEGQVQ